MSQDLDEEDNISSCMLTVNKAYTHPQWNTLCVPVGNAILSYCELRATFWFYNSLQFLFAFLIWDQGKLNQKRIKTVKF